MKNSSYPPASSCRPARLAQGSTAVITLVNVNDLERCMDLSVDIAPAFEEQARQWLDPQSGRTLEPGVRERLLALLESRTRAKAFIERWHRGGLNDQPAQTRELA